MVANLFWASSSESASASHFQYCRLVCRRGSFRARSSESASRGHFQYRFVCRRAPFWSRSWTGPLEATSNIHSCVGEPCSAPGPGDRPLEAISKAANPHAKWSGSKITRLFSLGVIGGQKKHNDFHTVSQRKASGGHFQYGFLHRLTFLGQCLEHGLPKPLPV